MCGARVSQLHLHARLTVRPVVFHHSAVVQLTVAVAPITSARRAQGWEIAPGTAPTWMYLVAIIVVGLLALFVIFHLVGGGPSHH